MTNELSIPFQTVFVQISRISRVEMTSRTRKTSKTSQDLLSGKTPNTSQEVQSRFTSEEDEQIIDLVRSNECLFNIADKQYKNNDRKHRLWTELAAKQNRDGESICHT